MTRAARCASGLQRRARAFSLGRLSAFERRPARRADAAGVRRAHTPLRVEAAARGAGSRAATGITSAGRRPASADEGVDRLFHAEPPGLRQSSRRPHGAREQLTRSSSRASRATRPTRPAASSCATRRRASRPAFSKTPRKSFVWKVFPEPSFEEKLEAARAATAHAAAHGVTSVQDMSAGNDVGVYQTLLERGELKTSIYAVSPLPDWERLGRVGVRRAFGERHAPHRRPQGLRRRQPRLDHRALLRPVPRRAEHVRPSRRRDVPRRRDAGARAVGRRAPACKS